MELNQADYEARVARRAAGQQSDEDNRLIKHYEANGFSTRDDSAGKVKGATLAPPADGTPKSDGEPEEAGTGHSGDNAPRPVDDDGASAEMKPTKKAAAGRATQR